MSGKALTDGEYRDLLVCLIEGVPNREVLNPEAIKAHLANKTASHEAVAKLLGQSPVNIVGEGYPVTVDYSLTLEQMIAVGHFGWVNSDITSEHFPIVGIGKVELEGQLVHYERNMSSEAVLADLDQKGLRSTTLPELLAFGAKYPEVQRQYPVIALGSFWQHPCGLHGVPCLGRDGRRREVGVNWFEDGWGGGYRFLAVCK